MSVCLLLVHIASPVSTNFLTLFFINCVQRLFIFCPFIPLFRPHCFIFTLDCFVCCMYVRPEILGARPLGLQRGNIFLRSLRPHVYCCNMLPNNKSMNVFVNNITHNQSSQLDLVKGQIMQWIFGTYTHTKSANSSLSVSQGGYDGMEICSA